MTAGAQRLHAVVHGYVQGVGYRVFAAREGRRLGLAGTVRNRPDGTVELVVEGDRPVLEELLRVLQRGPAEAEVQHVAVTWGPAQGCPPGFSIIE